jgi:hypothetical protein
VARLYTTGLETGDASDLVQMLSGASVVTTHPRSGLYGLKFNSNPYTEVTAVIGLNKTTLYARASLYLDVLSTPGSDLFGGALKLADAASSTIAYIFRQHKSDGTHWLYLSNVVGGVTASPVQVSPGQHLVIELKCVVSPTVGVVEMRIDAAVAATLTGQNTGSAAMDRFILFGALNGDQFGYSDAYMDDLAVDDAVYPGLGRLFLTP